MSFAKNKSVWSFNIFVTDTVFVGIELNIHFDLQYYKSTFVLVSAFKGFIGH